MFANFAQPRHLTVINRFSRSMSRSRCNTNTDPPCSPRTAPKDPPCAPKKLSKVQCTPPPPVVKSAWESGCCDICHDMMPRFDSIYYKRTDKSKRRYHQTWVECPSPVKKTKISCCYEQDQLPPIIKRPKNQRPTTACNMKRKDGVPERNMKCMRVVLPGCRSRRNSFHCLVERNPSEPCATRECAPYPSFSECTRSRPAGLPKKECGCVFDPQKCELFKEMARYLWLKEKPC